jgi:hypothetical protein
MFLRSCRLLVLALVVSACSSSAGASVGGDGGTAAPSRGTSSLIVRAELESFSGGSAFDAVETLRRRWTEPDRGSSFSGPIYAGIVVDGAFRGDINELHRMSTENIEAMRFLSASDATTKYGTGYLAGVIEVTILRGP